jgi:deoxyribodipyrimidine photolyase-related protein
MTTLPGTPAAEDVRWLFGVQLGAHFLDSPDQRVLLIESRNVFARRRFHRQKGHLVLSAMRHRAAELGERCDYRKSTTYGAVARDVTNQGDTLSVCHPTSFAALDLVRRIPGVQVLDARGFATSMAEFAAWADNRFGGLTCSRTWNWFSSRCVIVDQPPLIELLTRQCPTVLASNGLR